MPSHASGCPEKGGERGGYGRKGVGWIRGIFGGMAKKSEGGDW